MHDTVTLVCRMCCVREVSLLCNNNAFFRSRLEPQQGLRRHKCSRAERLESNTARPPEAASACRELRANIPAPPSSLEFDTRLQKSRRPHYAHTHAGHGCADAKYTTSCCDTCVSPTPEAFVGEWCELCANSACGGAVCDDGKRFASESDSRCAQPRPGGLLSCCALARYGGATSLPFGFNEPGCHGCVVVVYFDASLVVFIFWMRFFLMGYLVV